MSQQLPDCEVGDVIVSKFGNRWIVESWMLIDDQRIYALRNRPEEAPTACGTVVSGPLPEWAEKVQRAGLMVWQRPTPRCECPAYANAKGPYPSGFCPDCGKWFPGVTRQQAIERGHIPASLDAPQKGQGS